MASPAIELHPPLGASNHLRFSLATPNDEFSRYSTQVLHFGYDTLATSLPQLNAGRPVKRASVKVPATLNLANA